MRKLFIVPLLVFSLICQPVQANANPLGVVGAGLSIARIGQSFLNASGLVVAPYLIDGQLKQLNIFPDGTLGLFATMAYQSLTTTPYTYGTASNGGTWMYNGSAWVNDSSDFDLVVASFETTATNSPTVEVRPVTGASFTHSCVGLFDIPTDSMTSAVCKIGSGSAQTLSVTEALAGTKDAISDAVWDKIVADGGSPTDGVTVDPATPATMDVIDPADGSTKTVSIDPTTGDLIDSFGSNVNYLMPQTAIAGGTAASVVDNTTTTTETGTTPATSNIDFTPVTEAIGQLKLANNAGHLGTAEAIGSLNAEQSLRDSALLTEVQKATTPVDGQSKVAAIVAAPAPVFMGIAGFLASVQTSPVYLSLTNGLTMPSVAGYPSWTIAADIGGMGGTLSFSQVIDTFDYAFIFDVAYGLTLLGAAWFSWGLIFGGRR